MKKVFILTILALASAMAYAGPVSKEKALQVASKVFAAEPATKAAVGSDKLTVVWDGEFEKTKGATDPAFYVVAREKGGFVIVAGNDNVQPVLGFSFENPFKVEGMPDNVRWWMEQIKAYSRSARTSSPEIRQRWGAFEDTKANLPESGISDEYLGSRTVSWDQSEPFNYFAPTVTGQSSQAVTGCVPLAIAQIMTWHWADNASSGSGTVEGYSYSPDTGGSYSIPAHDLGTVYRWSEFKDCSTWADFYTSYPTMTELGINVAQLIYDIGTILQVEYNNSKSGEGTGTGGNLSRLANLVTMLKYNKGAYTIDRTSYSSVKFLSMFLAEINQRPVYYSGSGHAYIADGHAKYNGDPVIHFNLGWGGYCNGYYYYDNTDTESGNYTGYTALFDFYPDAAGTTEFVQKLGYFYDGSKGGLRFDSSSSFASTPVVFRINNLENSGAVATSGSLGVFKINGNDAPDATPLQEEIFNLLPVGAYYPNKVIYSYANYTTGYVLGDKIAIYYKPEGASGYSPIEYEKNGKILGEIPFFPAAFIKTETSYSVGDYFVFQLTNHNYQYDTATWTVTDPSGTSTDYTMDDYHVELSTAGEYKITVSIPGQEKVTAFIKVE